MMRNSRIHHCLSLSLVALLGILFASGPLAAQGLPPSLLQKRVQLDLKRADSALDSGLLKDAEKLYLNILKDKPNDLEATLGLGLVYAGQKDRIQEAHTLLMEVLAADPNNAEAAAGLGRIYLTSRQHYYAINWLHQARNLDPEMLDVDFYLGSAYVADEFPLAGMSFLQSARVSRPELEFARDLSLGAAHVQVGLREEGLCMWRNAAARAEAYGIEKDWPTNPIVDQAYDLENQLHQDYMCDPRLTASLGILTRFDSNPGVSPAAQAFGQIFVPTESWANVYRGRISYDIMRDWNSELTASYDTYFTNNYSLRQSDLFTQDISLTYNRNFIFNDMPTIAGVRTNFLHYKFDYRDFLGVPAISPYWTFIQSDTETFTLLGSYEFFNFLGQGGIDGTPFDQDAHNMMIGGTKTWNFPCEEILLVAGYQFNGNDAEGSNFDYLGNRVQAGFNWFLPEKGLKAHVNYTYQYRGYQNIDTLFGQRRIDNQQIGSVGLTYSVNNDLDLITSYNIVRNESNIIINDFTRHIVDFGFVYYMPGGRLDRNDRTVYGRTFGRDLH